MLYRSRLDCTAPKQFVTSVNRCAGLTVDHGSDRLFWVDIDIKRIESVLLSGSGDGHRVVLASLTQPYTLAVYGPHLYWVDWTDDRIERADKMTGDNRTVVLDNVKFVVDLLVFHRSQLAGWTPCVEHNGGCQSLCFARPLTADGQWPARRCGCRSHYRLAPDGRRCLREYKRGRASLRLYWEQVMLVQTFVFIQEGSYQTVVASHSLSCDFR